MADDYWENQKKETEVKERMRKKAAKIMRRWKKTAIISTIILILFAGLMVGTAALGPGYTYQKDVHGYMEQAYYSADPVLMQQNINLAKQGMLDLGLTPDMYGSFWYWEQTPERQMNWEYQHLNSIDVRCTEFIAWIHAQNDTGSQQMQDVYSQKLNNIREFVKNDGGWSDDIAQAAYFTNFNVFFAIGYIPILIALLIFVGWEWTRLIICGFDSDELAKKMARAALRKTEEEDD